MRLLPLFFLQFQLLGLPDDLNSLFFKQAMLLKNGFVLPFQLLFHSLVAASLAFSL